MAAMASTERAVACCMPAICVLISSVALAVCPASALTSVATTAKPRPASPARAASIVAFSASRLVCSAMAVISLTTSPMRLAALSSALISTLVRAASPTAFSAIILDWATWRSISITEDESSSAADAMSRTLLEASADDEVAPAVRFDASSATSARWPEAPSICSEIAARFSDVGGDLLLPARPRGRLVRDRAVELDVALHGILEHGDGAGQRPDLVAAMAMRDADAFRADGDRFGDAGDLAQGPRHGAPDDHHADAGETHRRQREQAQGPDRAVQAGLQLGIDALGARIVQRRQRLEILVERGAHAAVGFVVTPFATLGRGDLGPQPHQLLAEVDELLDALGKLLELFRIVAAHLGAPLLHHLGNAIVELEQQVAEALGRRNVGRHVDAARLHDDGIDQPVHPLNVLGSHQGGFVLAGHRGVVAGVDDRNAGQRRGGDSQQGENTVKLGANGKIRQIGHGASRQNSPLVVVNLARIH